MDKELCRFYKWSLGNYHKKAAGIVHRQK